jgi:hypothetical protein
MSDFMFKEDFEFYILMVHIKHLKEMHFKT